MSKTVHAFCDDVLADHDAVELARMVREREVSAPELTRAAIARAERVQPSLAAIAHPLFEQAIAAAERPLAGAFAGVPMFVKDTMNVLGAPTRLGSQAIGSRPAKADAPFAKLLAAHGVVLLGKTCLPELGFNATTEPQGGTPTRNPWNTEHSSGGSSGGSAALVAAGVVPLAHGNDGGGSLRIPAACCGLVGLKSTRGRLPMDEAARQLPLDIVCEGVMTRSVRDTAHFYVSMTFGKISISRDFDASRVDKLTRGLASFYKRRMLQTPGTLFRLARSARVYARSLVDHDVMLSPVVAHTTPKLGYLSPDQDFETVFARLHDYACFTPLNNATGSPAMSLPLGSTSDGLPIGVHFSGRHGEERTLLELAYELEQSRPFRRIQAAATATT